MSRSTGDIGTQLRDARHAKRMTIPQLSHKSGVAFGTISEIETGLSDPRISTVRALLKGMGYDGYRLKF